MPRYEIRLESPEFTKDSGEPHFRLVRGEWTDEDEARKWARRKEFSLASYQLDDFELARLEALEAEGGLANSDKAKLFTHRQSEPYEVVGITEIGE